MARTIERSFNVAAIFREIMEEYAGKIDRRLHDALEARGIRASGATIDSLRVFVNQTSEGALTDLMIYFRSSGRIQEMRNIRTGGRQIPLDTISDWVKSVGVNKFKYVPGYEDSSQPLGAIKNAEQRIGFAIALSKQRLGKRKVRKWYNKNVYDAIFGNDGLINRILDDLPEEALDSLKQLEA